MAKGKLLQCGGSKGQYLPESQDHEVVQSNHPLRDQAEGGGVGGPWRPQAPVPGSLTPSEQLHSLSECFLSSTS